MKSVIFIGSSQIDLKNFPSKVRRNAGFQLSLVQAEEEPDDWKPMPSIGSGVKELRIHADGEFRVIYIAKFKSSIYVLHAFQKKTQKTRTRDIELAKTRFTKLIQKRRIE